MTRTELECLVGFRMTELEAREELSTHLSDVHAKKLWKGLGHLSFAEFCREELGFERNEIRDIQIRPNLIVTSDQLSSPDRTIQSRIDKLRSWRRECAKRNGFAAYRIITNSTLLEIARTAPKTSVDLAQTRGIGPKKLKDFGTEILAVIQ